MNLLSQKVEGVLGTVRTLREENAKLKKELANFQAMSKNQAQALTEAKAKINDYSAALNARANQAAAQDKIIDEKNGIIDSLNGQVAEKNGIIDSLNGQVAEKNGIIDSLNGQVQTQGSEIAEAQDRFKKLLSIIESELGTEIPLSNQAEEQPQQQEQPKQNNDSPDLFASNGGSQGNFFG